MTKERLKHLQETIAAARRVAEFSESEVWAKDLMPKLAAEQAKADKKRSYNPGGGLNSKEPELERAYYAGVFETIEHFAKILRHFAEDGDEAQKELAKMEKTPDEK